MTWDGRDGSPAPRMGRRRFLEVGSVVLGSAVLGAGRAGAAAAAAGVDDGRLKSRPSTPAEPLPPGRHALGLGGDRDGVLFIPGGRRQETPAALVVMLHGAGGGAPGALRPFEALADRHGLVLLAPESRGSTWDLIRGGFGPDVSFIDRALAVAFRHCAVDRARIALEGFSDGASYALALGLTNGDLFRKVVAFSPGFLSLVRATGKPRVYMAHGTRDTVLPIERCSRRIVPRLKDAGYDVRYEEFEGGHTVPEAIAEQAAAWLSVAEGRGRGE